MILICWRSVILEKYHQQAWQRSQAPKCAAMGNHLDPIMVFLLKMTTCYPLSRACDSAMALGLPDVLSVKNVVHAFSQVLRHGRITYYTYYTGTLFQDCHKRTHWHELRWHEQLVSWKSQDQQTSLETFLGAKFITGRCELMSNFNWSAVVSSRRLEAKIMTKCGEIKRKVQSNWYAFMVPRCVNLSDDSCFKDYM